MALTRLATPAFRYLVLRPPHRTHQVFLTADGAECYARKRCEETGARYAIERHPEPRAANAEVLIAEVVKDAVGRVWTEVQPDGCALL